jgi:hypothetical protein
MLATGIGTGDGVDGFSLESPPFGVERTRGLGDGAVFAGTR